MKRNIAKLFLSMLLMFAISNIWADDTNIKVAGTSYSAASTVANSKLTLNGVGIRTKFFVKVYALGLYVPKASSSADDLIQMAGPKLVEIHMLRDVDAKTFVEALQEGLNDNNSKDTLATIKPQIDQLEQLMVKTKQVKVGDVLRLEFNPASGTQVILNGSKLGNTLGGGANFYTALLKVWLGKTPVDSDLKLSIMG
jgi:hypothetical protein